MPTLSHLEGKQSAWYTAQMQERYAVGALGGTFDHFHRGHELFVSFAANQAHHLIIGITDPDLTKHKQLAELIQPYEVRLQAVQRYLEHIANCSFEFVRLTDPYGPTLGEREIDVLFVTKLTEQGGVDMNTLRTQRGLSRLPVKICQMYLDQTKRVLTSTRIRRGAVSREGVVFDQLFAHDRVMTNAHKQALKTPWGEIVRQPADSAGFVAVVGDTTLAQFIKKNWRYDVGIYDLTEQRHHTHLESLLKLQPTQQLRNPASMITANTALCLQKFIDHRSSTPDHVLIDGEEDLLVLPLIALSPLGTKIYYGQPHVGMVEVVVSEALKIRLTDLLQDDTYNLHPTSCI